MREMMILDALDGTLANELGIIAPGGPYLGAPVTVGPLVRTGAKPKVLGTTHPGLNRLIRQGRTVAEMEAVSARYTPPK